MLNLLNRLILEAKVGERYYALHMTHDSPLDEIESVLTGMLQFVQDKKAAVAAAEVKPPVAAPSDPPKV